MFTRTETATRKKSAYHPAVLVLIAWFNSFLIFAASTNLSGQFQIERIKTRVKAKPVGGRSETFPPENAFGLLLEKTGLCAVKDVTVSVEYLGAAGETLSGTPTQLELGGMGPEGTAECYFAPPPKKAAAYRVRVEYSDRGLRRGEYFLSPAIRDNPRPAAPAEETIPTARVICTGYSFAAKQTGAGSNAMILRGTVRLLNVGKMKPEGVRIVVRWYAWEKGRKLDVARVPTSWPGDVPGTGKEAVAEISFKAPRNVPSETPFEVFAVCKPVPPEILYEKIPFEGVADVEFGELTLSRDERSVVMRGRVRNGLHFAINKLLATVVFLDTDPVFETRREVARWTFRIPGKLPPGGETEFLEVARGTGNFSELRWLALYGKAGGEGSENRVAGAMAEFTGLPVVEVAMGEPIADPNGSVSVNGAARNGSRKTIDKLRVTLTFLSAGAVLAEEEIEFQGALAPGETRKFQAVIEASGGYDAWTFKYDYRD